MKDLFPNREFFNGSDKSITRSNGWESTLEEFKQETKSKMLTGGVISHFKNLLEASREFSITYVLNYKFLSSVQEL